VDEFLHFYTTYGVRQVLNVNPGTVLAGYMLTAWAWNRVQDFSLHGQRQSACRAVDSAGARLFARDDGSTPSSASTGATRSTTRRSRFRPSTSALGFEDAVRFEHHITETQKSIVRQPYDRRAELIELTRGCRTSRPSTKVAIRGRRRASPPSDILDYFRDKSESSRAATGALASTSWTSSTPRLTTARALTEHGLSFLAAPTCIAETGGQPPLPETRRWAAFAGPGSTR